jgi:hypothetical protein
MENAETLNVDGAALASRQRAHRSAISNGTRLFCVDGLDGRSQTARRFRDLVEGMGNDLGGSDRLSEGQRQLIRRAATLSIMSESVEADFIRNLASIARLMASFAIALAVAFNGLAWNARRGW